MTGLLDHHHTSGLCGSFYHDCFPAVSVLEYGGTYPWAADPDVITKECPDRVNLVTLELRRIR